MQPIVRVFVSSTWLDLQPERLAVEKALQRMRQTKLNGMEYFGSSNETTRDVSLKEVERSDVYIGIISGMTTGVRSHPLASARAWAYRRGIGFGASEVATRARGPRRLGPVA